MVVGGNASVSTLTLNIASGTSTYSGTLGGAGADENNLALTKTGAGTLVLNAANTYTGGTTLSQGHLQLGANNALGGGSSAFNFAGGILDANNHSASIGALSLTASSTINLVADSTHASLTFTSATGNSGVTLTINNWSGTAGQSGTDDQIFVSGTASAQFLADINFAGISTGAMQLGTGEIVPVPEPANVALGVFGVLLVGLGLGRHFQGVMKLLTPNFKLQRSSKLETARPNGAQWGLF